MGVATGFKSLLALRLALGVGEAAAYPQQRRDRRTLVSGQRARDGIRPVRQRV